MRTALLTLIVLLSATTTSSAQTVQGAWAEKMFKEGKELSHDFGNVPRGAQLYHRFTMTNIYAVQMEITGIDVSCGCTTATASKRVLAPRESATLDVSMDARRFTGAKTVTIKVSVGPEFVSTAELKVMANSRSDLVFNPGDVSFGTVTHGQEAEQTIEVDYAGTLDWKVTDVVFKDPLEVKFVKLDRKAGQVGYRITVKLKKETPAGALKEEIHLKTNDPNSPLVPIVVEATVQSPVVVAPSALNLGSVKVGDTLTRRVVVRGTKAFKLQGIDGLGNGLKLGNELTSDEATVQTVTFQIQIDKAGEFKREIKIRTGLQDTPLIVTIEGSASP
jgi:hypothetical protein